MPLEFQRFAAQGPRDPRETARTCNNLGEAVSIQLTPLDVTVVEASKPFTVTNTRVRPDNAVLLIKGIATDFFVTNQVAGSFDIDWPVGGFVSTPIRYLILG